MQDVAASSHASGLSEPCPIGDSCGSTLRDISKKQRHLLDDPLKVGPCRKPEHGGTNLPIVDLDGYDSLSVDSLSHVWRDATNCDNCPPAPSSVGPPQVAPRLSGSQDPLERRRPVNQRGNNSNDLIDSMSIDSSVDCVGGRDATNVAIRCNILHPNLKRVASTPLDWFEREVFVLNASTSSSEDAPLSTPPPSSLGHNHVSVSGQPIRCIRSNYKCPKAGWSIEEYCEACHG